MLVPGFGVVSGPRLLRFRHTSATAAVQRLYLEYPEMAELPFFEQQAMIDDLHLSYTAGLVQGLRTLGYDALDILYDVPQLQSAWERDTGTNLGTVNRPLALAYSTIAELRPSIVLEQSFGLFHPADLDHLRTEYPFVDVLAMHVGFPLVGYPVDFGKSPQIDVMFITNPDFAEDYRAVGIRQVEVVPHGFDSSVLARLSAEPRDLPLVFAGSSGFGFGETHWSRFAYLDALCATTPIHCYLQEPAGGASIRTQAGDQQSRLKNTVRTATRRAKDRIRPLLKGSHVAEDAPRRELINRPPLSWAPPTVPLQVKYPSRCEPAVFGMDMYRVLNRAEVTFHRGADVDGNYSTALRLYETTGVGSLLFTNHVKQLPTIFEPDREIVTYGSVSECTEKAAYLLDNLGVAREIAEAGQRRTLGAYTLEHRAAQFHEVFTKLL